MAQKNMGYTTGPAGKSRENNTGPKAAPQVIGSKDGGCKCHCGVFNRGGMNRGYLGKRGR
jgi:hypothetical protein